MPSINLTRENAWADKFREYEILVDGTPRGWIKNSKTVQLSVAQGQHEMQLRIDMCTSPIVLVDVGADGITMICRPKGRSWLKTALGLDMMMIAARDHIRLWQAPAQPPPSAPSSVPT